MIGQPIPGAFLGRMHKRGELGTVPDGEDRLLKRDQPILPTGPRSTPRSTPHLEGDELAWLRKTQSRLPSFVYSLKAIPLTSRIVSGEPFSPAVVEKREKSGVRLPTRLRNSALVTSLMSRVTSKYPKAPHPRAWTTLSLVISGVMAWEESRAGNLSSPFGNALAVERLYDLDQIAVLEEGGCAHLVPNPLASRRISYGGAF